MESHELEDMAPLNEESKTRYRKPSKSKIFCRGLETCPTLSLMIIGTIVMVLGILAIISGASCSCKKAVPSYQRFQNSTAPVRCTQCSWLWLECKVGPYASTCKRGCVITPLDASGTPVYEDGVCLPPTGEKPNEMKYNVISPIQIIGVCIGSVALLMMIASFIVSYRLGRHYLL